MIVTMGVITIEVPQSVRTTYKIESEDSAKDVIEELDKVATKKKYIDLSDVLGIWADRDQSRDEIAEELRKNTNSRTKNG